MYRDKTKYGMNNTEIFILIHQIFIFTLNKMHYSNICLAVLQKYIAKKNLGISSIRSFLSTVLEHWYTELLLPLTGRAH